jgi:hypothetical protein
MRLCYVLASLREVYDLWLDGERSILDESVFYFSDLNLV